MLTNLLFTLCALIPFYLIGAIPTGWLVGKLHGVEIGEHGSGNVGATNVARVIGKNAGLTTLFFDIIKGLIAVALAMSLSPSKIFGAAAAFSVVLGHCYSVPGKLKGGKGVATAFGAALYMNSTVAWISLAIFVAVFITFRYVSLASVSALLSAPLIAILLNLTEEYFYALAAIALLVTWRHKENLARLTRNQEPKFQNL